MKRLSGAGVSGGDEAQFLQGRGEIVGAVVVVAGTPKSS